MAFTSPVANNEIQGIPKATGCVSSIYWVMPGAFSSWDVPRKPYSGGLLTR